MEPRDHQERMEKMGTPVTLVTPDRLGLLEIRGHKVFKVPLEI
jgi:hypothetical protein